MSENGSRLKAAAIFFNDDRVLVQVQHGRLCCGGCG